MSEEFKPNWDVSAETMGELMAKNWQQAVTINELQAQIYRIRDAYYNGKGGDGMDALGYAIMETEAVNLATVQDYHPTNLCCKIIHQGRIVHSPEDFDTELQWLTRCVADAKDQYSAELTQHSDKALQENQ